MIDRRGRTRALAVVLAAGAVVGVAACERRFTDPRGVDAAEIEALEQAAETAPADDGGDADGGDGAGAASGPTARAAGHADAGGAAPEGFDLLTPATVAADHPLSELWGPDAFAVLDDGEPVVEWANRDELWAEVTSGAASACRAAGPPIEQPAFAEPEPLEAAVDAYWNNRSTSGRGTLVSVMCAYVDAERGPVERYEAHLVATDPDTLAGRVVASSPPWEFALDDYAEVGELVVDRDRALARWAREQDRVAADPVAPSPGQGIDADPEDDEPPGSDAEER